MTTPASDAARPLDQQGIIGRIRHLIAISSRPQASFARKIGVDPSNLSKQLSGRLPVTEGLVNRIVADLGVAKPWLRDGEGVPFPKPRHAATEEALLMERPQTAIPVPVYDIDVTAGSSELSRLLTTDRIVGSVDLPRLNPDDIIVRVSGDSMTPVIRDGAYIAIRPVAGTGIIFYGQIYVVVLDDYRMVKYLRRAADESKVLLRSANDNYDDIEIARSEIRSLFIVDAVLNYDFRT